MLEQEEANKTGEKSTLGDLSTYLLLSQAAEKYGAHPAIRALQIIIVRKKLTHKN